MKLYEIVEAYENAKLLGLEQEDLKTVLDSINISLKEKAINIAKIKFDLKSDIDSIKVEKKRLSDRQKSLENNLKRLEEYLSDAMLATGVEEFKTPLFTINFRKSTKTVVNMENLDKNYIKQVVTLSADKMKIKKDLKAGIEIKGASLEEHQNLQIK